MALHVVDEAGDLSSSSLGSLGTTGSPVSIVAAIGACGVRKTALLNTVFGTSFGTNSDPEGAQEIQGVWGQRAVAPEIAVLAEEPRNMVVLDVEGYDSTDRTRVDLQQRCQSWAMTLADVIVWTVTMGDLVRGTGIGMEILRAAWIEEAKLIGAGVVNRRTFKRLFVVVVRDFENDMVLRQQLISAVLQKLETIWSEVPRGVGGSSSRVVEAYDFEFITLPRESYDKEAYEEEIDTLNGRLLDPAADDYMFESGAYKRTSPKSLEDQGLTLWEELKQESQKDVPEENELNGTIACDRVMKNALEKFERSVRAWRRQIDGGTKVENFGKECAELTKKTLSVYDSDAADYSSTSAFSRKRSELQERLDTESYELFAKQTLLLREEVYLNFKAKLLRIDMNPKVEKEINRTVRDGIKKFNEEVNSIKPRGVSWHYDNEAKLLSSHMREDATDRLQEARLSGSYKPEKRQPIALSFHYLNPAPFGFKDSRYERLSLDDRMTYNVKPSTRVAEGAMESVGEPLGPSIPILDTPEQKWDRTNKEFVYKEEKRTPGLMDLRKAL